MTEENPFLESSQAVQAHLGITQAVIQRFALNSASCKTWCITLASAILIAVANNGKSEYAYIALIPIILSLALDAYYLALEKMFRLSYNSFIDKLHQGKVIASDLFVVAPSEGMIRTIGISVLSIWPFYAITILMVLIIKKVVL